MAVVVLTRSCEDVLALAMLIQLNAPTTPDGEAMESNASRSTCVPAESDTPDFETVEKTAKLLVSVTPSVPVTLAPSISAWKCPPGSGDATRKPRS